MAVSCITTKCGSFYSVTDSEIVYLLRNYIGYGEPILREKAEKELSAAKLNSEFEVFYKNIKRILYDNFKINRKIDKFDDQRIAKIIFFIRQAIELKVLESLNIEAIMNLWMCTLVLGSRVCSYDITRFYF